MGLLLIGLGLTLLFGLLLILTLNYSVYTWESKKIEDLSSKIRPNQTEDILLKSSASRGFTSKDLSGLTTTGVKSKILLSAGNFYDRTMILIKDHEYPTWFTKMSKIFTDLRHDTWKTLKRFLAYLMSLTRPVEKNADPRTQAMEERKMSEIEEVVERVNEVNRQEKEVDENILNTAEAKIQGIDAFEPADPRTVEEKGETQLATLNLLSGTKGDEDKAGVLEKLENRLLGKLKEAGLGNYDLWLELGELYFKFNEKEKAKEIYALVLKHAEGKPKEMARDRLIGL
jgi:hypothetical protein